MTTPRRRISLPLALELFGFAAALALAVLLYAPMRRLPVAAVSPPASWQSVPARIVAVDWQDPRRSAGYAHIRYAYEFEGRPFEAERRQYLSGPNDSAAIARAVEALSAKQPVSAFVNPADPESARLQLAAGATGSEAQVLDAHALLFFGAVAAALLLSYRLLTRLRPQNGR